MILKESEWKLRQQQDQNCAMNEEPLQNKCQDQKERQDCKNDSQGSEQ